MTPAERIQAFHEKYAFDLKMTFFSPDARPDDLGNVCPICRRRTATSARYPDYVCKPCASALTLDGEEARFGGTVYQIAGKGLGQREPSRLGNGLRERVTGAVLGAAIGDALGHPTEFVGSYDELRERFGPNGVEGFALYWEASGARFAPYTDDTQMAEIVLRCALDALDAGESLEVGMERLARAVVDWSLDPQGGHRAPGRACLMGASALARGTPWREAGEADAGGCGSVMRAYPMGLVFHATAEAREAWAVAQSRLTHNAPIALAACSAMAHATASALRGDTPSETLKLMVEAASHHDTGTADMIEAAGLDAQQGTEPEAVYHRLRGWAAHEAIAAATYAYLRHPDDFCAAALEAANTPGDSDSIATLAGALVGARCGVNAIPAEWRRDVERSDELTALAERTLPSAHYPDWDAILTEYQSEWDELLRSMASEP